MERHIIQGCLIFHTDENVSGRESFFHPMDLLICLGLKFHAGILFYMNADHLAVSRQNACGRGLDHHGHPFLSLIKRTHDLKRGRKGYVSQHRPPIPVIRFQIQF